jgi:predicted enzyme related to lactoylglutathione lyase
MPSVDRHTPDSFCWFELAITDQSAAKNFYTFTIWIAILKDPQGAVFAFYQAPK